MDRSLQSVMKFTFKTRKMKTLKSIVTGMALLLAGTLQAQISVNVNVGSPPMWGPVGYSDVQYYYLPDVEAYYDVPTANFIYYEGGSWVHRNYLPRRYRNYDLYGGYKVVMTDYRGNAPYTHFKEYKHKYAKGYRGHAQKNIGERPEKGNSKARMQSSGKSYKKEIQGHNRSAGPGHNNQQRSKGNKQKSQGHGGGHGKK